METMINVLISNENKTTSLQSRDAALSVVNVESSRLRKNGQLLDTNKKKFKYDTTRQIRESEKGTCQIRETQDSLQNKLKFLMFCLNIICLNIHSAIEVNDIATKRKKSRVIYPTPCKRQINRKKIRSLPSRNVRTET